MKYLVNGVDIIWDTLTLKESSSKIVFKLVSTLYFICVLSSFGSLLIQLITKSSQDVSLVNMVGMLITAIIAQVLLIETFKNYNEKRDNSK